MLDLLIIQVVFRHLYAEGLESFGCINLFLQWDHIRLFAYKARAYQ